MSQLGARLLAASAPHALRRFRSSCRKPVEVQQARLLDIVRANASTEYGRGHGFERIRSFSDYQHAVPVSSYDDLEPFIAAAMAGEPRQLTSEPPALFTMTSGTTGARKFIPMTPAERQAKSRRSRLWAAALFRDHPSIVGGRVLSMVSPEVESYAPNGVPCGAESGHFYRTMPRAVRSMYSTPYPVFTLTDYEAKYYALLRIAAGDDIRCLVTPNPSTIVLLADRLGEHTESIIRDVHDGTLRCEDAVPPAIRPALRRSPDRRRAQELEHAAAASDRGVLQPSLIWPRLAALGCWKAGSVAPYLDRFEHFFDPRTAVRELGYLATETAGSLPFSDEGAAGVAAIGTDVLELYPAELDHAPPGHELLTVGQLELGASYRVVVTTAAGLYRYDMSDIVEVVGYHERTPVLQFVQKANGIVSLTGEKLTETQVLAAVGDALAPELDPTAFVSAVVELVDEVPQAAFLVETAGIDDRAATDVIARLDRALGQRNVEYEEKRSSGRYRPPALRLLPVGELDRYRRRMTDAGRADGQFKILRLTADPAFASAFAVTREVGTGAAATAATVEVG